MTPVLVVLAAFGSLFFATSIYLGWRLARIRDSAGEWQERCEVAERRSALFGRHLAGLAEVIHNHGGGVVNRYYETSALRFVLAKQAPAVVGRDSSVPQWLRSQAEFFHALADRAFGVDANTDARKRIDGIRAAHPIELSAYENMAINPPVVPPVRSEAAPEPAVVDGLLGAEKDASRYLAQLSAALAFAGRLAPAGEEGERALFDLIARLCEAADDLLETFGVSGMEERRIKAVLGAVELLRDAMASPLLSGAQAKRPLPTATQVAALRTVARSSSVDGAGPTRQASRLGV
jgi:hypothetical protein